MHVRSGILSKFRDQKEIISEDLFCCPVILSISPTLSQTLSEDLFCWASELVSPSSTLSLI